MRYSIFRFVLTVSVALLGVTGNFNPFMDSIYFTIDWAGPDHSLKFPDDIDLLATDDSTSVYITTTNKEKYRCLLPPLVQSNSDKEKEFGHPATFELELLKPLFEQTTCTYRLETYWTYELCHGKHLRQYHEEKEIGKRTKLTEYFLGRYKSETFQEAYDHAKEDYEQHKEKPKEVYRTKKVQGIEIPYYEVMFDEGTVCDLTGSPRRTAVHYVCQPDGRGEIYELKEVSSCEYEIVVLTSLLCVHPIYGPKKEVVNTIHCHALDDSPQKPQSMDLFENSKERYNSKEFWQMEIPQQEEEHQEAGVKPPDVASEQKFVHIGEQTDNAIIKDFLAGDFCIHGGSGWWKYEFCYGRHVKQYHEERHNRVVIMLGEWDTAAHLLWIGNNPKKRPAPVGQRKFIRQFYGNGNVCDITGKKRVVEVKLTCMDNPSYQHSMGIYLLEPKTCQYKLVVESPLLCSIVEQADADGLVPTR